MRLACARDRERTEALVIAPLKPEAGVPRMCDGFGGLNGIVFIACTRWQPEADVPFPVSLHRGSLDGPHFPSERPLRGRFIVKFLVASDLEKAQTARLRKACETKYPKLAVWKRDAGARTVLVLEEIAYR